MRAFSEIIDNLIVKRGDMNEQEVTVVKEELDAKSSMILMIFRFFLQSNEYQFFIRRLKNVVMTKASLRQLSSTPHQVLQKSDSTSNQSLLDKSYDTNAYKQRGVGD